MVYLKIKVEINTKENTKENLISFKCWLQVEQNHASRYTYFPYTAKAILDIFLLSKKKLYDDFDEFLNNFD